MIVHKIIKRIHPSFLVITAVNIGGALEWYEVGLFICWPLIILQKLDFFEQTVADSIGVTGILLMVAFALASGGARGIGGWFFGKKGDKEGRRIAFALTILLATLPSLLVPLISFFIPYQVWSSYVTIIFAVVKFLQGMPAGGEFPGAICFLAETGNMYSGAPSWVSRRYVCSYTILGPQIGLMLSMIVCIVLKSLFSIEFLMTTGWRFVFLISGILGIGGFIIRHQLHETTAFLSIKSHHKIALHPVRTIFTKYLSHVIFGFSISIFETVLFIIISIAPLYYSKAPFFLSNDTVLLCSIASTILRSLCLIFMGRLLIRYLNFPWLRLSAWGIIVLSFLLYIAFRNGNFWYSVLLNIGILFLYSIQAAILPSLLAELFPTNIRYTGIAFSFNICDGILLTIVTGVSYMAILNNSAAFLLLLPVAGALFLVNMRHKLANKPYYK